MECVTLAGTSTIKIKGDVIMRIDDLIVEFNKGAWKGKASSVHIEGCRLYSYNTIIAIRVPHGILLNEKWYSMTTTRLQNRLKAKSNVLFTFPSEYELVKTYYFSYVHPYREDEMYEKLIVELEEKERR